MANMQNVHDICHEAIENARYVCEEHYALFKGPPIQLLCPKDVSFPYVPGHLYVLLYRVDGYVRKLMIDHISVSNSSKTLYEL